MDKAIVEECLKRTRELLETEWPEISSMKDESEGRIKISLAYLISYKGQEQALKTTITFGRKVVESRESIINPGQLDLPMEGQDEPEEPDEEDEEGDEEEAEEQEIGAKRRRRAA